MREGLNPPARRIPIAGPSITQREIDLVTAAVSEGWYANAGHFQDRFERAFASYIGVRYAAALPSCTSAIHLALLALGVGPGDEVIVPDITWIATAAPIDYVGATPVFADVDPETWCISPGSFHQCITDHTRAVIPVDLYGNVADMGSLRTIARNRGIAVVEDAAEAVGAELDGQKAGSLGDAGVFSFHGSKTLTTGEGGMLVTDRQDVLDRVLVLRDHGRRPGERRLFWNHEIAHKYRMSGLQAALGLAQLERIEELLARKRQAFDWYAQRLAGLPGLTLNRPAAGTVSSYWMVTVLVDPGRYGLDKEAIMSGLSERGVDSRPFFYPLSSLPAYAGRAEAGAARLRNINAYRISPTGVNLPSSLSLTEDDVERSCQALREVLAIG